MTKNLLSICLLLTLGQFTLSAQTAHAGATIPVGSGFYSPYGMAVDTHGNVFVADAGNNQVKEIVAANGVVSASSQVDVVGGGFNFPVSVAVDASGNVFVCDTGNSAAKEIVAVNGVVSASSQVNVIGNGFYRPYGLALDSHGNVFVSDYGHNQVKEIVAVNGVVSSASQVNVIAGGLHYQNGLAVDSNGNVFVADTNVGEIKEIVAVNGVVSSASQINIISSGFYHPTGVAVDGHGNVFVTDPTSSVDTAFEIVAVNGVVSSNSSIQTVGVGAASAQGVAVDSNGNVFVASALGNYVVETLSANRTFPTIPVGANSAPLTIYFTFDTPGTLAATPYVVLTQGAQNLDFQPVATQPANACAGGQSYNAGDICAVNVTFTPSKPYQRMGAVQLMGAAGTPIATFNLTGTGTGPQVVFPGNTAVGTLASGFSKPFGVAVDGSGNVYVADAGSSSGGWSRTTNCVTNNSCGNGNSGSVSTGSAGLYQIAAATGTLNTIGGGFGNPAGVAMDGSGNLFVADPGNGAVYQVVAVNGVVLSTSAVKPIGNVNGSFSTPTGVALDGGGDVFVADPGNSAVYEIVAVNGVVTANSVVNTIGNFTFNTPTGVALDFSGDVFVADSGNNAVYEIMAVGGVVTANSVVETIGTFNAPTGVALDGSGNLYVAATSGTTTLFEVLAGNGTVSASSTVIPLGSAFNGPSGVAIDARGNLFIADTGNQTVKEIDRADPPSLTFTSTPVGAPSSDSPHSILFENSGNAPLTAVSPGLLIGANFIQIPGSGTPADCSTSFSLSPGQECNLSVSFTPTTVGPLSGTAIFIDNALNATPSVSQVLQLSGTGLQAVQGITFNNPGTQVVGAPLTLSASTSSNLTVSYSATGQCTLNGSVVTFTVAGSCSITASLNGNSLYLPAKPVPQNFTVELQITPSAANNSVIPPTTVNSATPTTQTFNYNVNGGTVASVLVLTQGIQNLDFTLQSTNCIGIADGSACGVSINFIPKAPGLRMGAIELLDNNNNILNTTYISGIGQGSGIAFNSVSPVTPPLTGVTNPYALTIDAAGNLYVANASGNHQLLKFAPGATTSASAVSSGAPATALALDGAGDLYMELESGGEILRLPAGSTNTPAPFTPGSCTSLAFDGAGNLYGACVQGVMEYPASGAAPITIYPGSTLAVAVDAAGDVFASTGANSLMAIRVGGVAAQTLLTGVTGINSLAVDAAGDLFFADSGGIFELTPASSTPVSLAAGPSFYSLALDASGNLWVINGASVQEFPRSQPSALSFANTSVLSTSSDSPRTVSAQNIGNQPLTVSGFSNNANFSGTSSCSSAAPGAFCNLSFTFNPTQAGPLTASLVPVDNLLTATQPTFTLSGAGLQIAPTIATPPAAGAITYGQPLGASTLSGGIASTPGIFAWTNGTVVLNAGAQTAGVTFTPTSANYKSVTLSVSVTINKATPTITTPPTASAIAYRQPLSASTLTNGVASTAGTFAWTTGATVLNAGKQTQSVTFTPSSSNFTSVIVNVSVAVNQAPQTVTIAPITRPTALDAYTLSATSTTSGTPTFASTTTAVCTVSGSKLSLLGTGTCGIAATVPATTNYLPGSAAYTFTVAPPYTITVDSIITTVCRGAVAAFVLNVQSLGVFKGNVTLSCAGGPTGASCVDFPKTVPVNPTGLAASGFLVPLKAATGTYTVTFTGVSGQQSATTQATITVK